MVHKGDIKIVAKMLKNLEEEYGKVESMPVLEGKRMIIFIAPKKKK